MVFQTLFQKQNTLHGLPGNKIPWLWSCLLLNSRLSAVLVIGRHAGSKWSATNHVSMEITLRYFGHFVNTLLEYFSSDKSGLFCQKNAKSRKTSALSAVFFTMCLFMLKLFILLTVAFHLELIEIIGKAT